MKKLQTVSLLATGLLALFGATSSLKAQTLTNVLTNGNFDAPGEAVQTNGFSTTIGWKDAFPTRIDGGVFNNGTVQSGANAAYVAGPNNTATGTDGAFQLTSQIIQLGDMITLTYYAANSYQAQGQSVNLISAASQSAAYSATSLLKASPVTFTGGGYNQYTITYTAVAADVGKNLGVEFDSANSGFDGYTNYDTFVLTDAPAATGVPEPTTWAAMLCGLGILVGFKARRRIS